MAQQSAVDEQTRNLAEDVATSRSVLAEAASAMNAGDNATFLAKLTELNQLRPSHPEVVYHFAAALSLTNDAHGALAQLQRLADMGVSASPAEDPRFAALAESAEHGEAFSAIVQALGNNLQQQPTGAVGTTLSLAIPDFIPESPVYHPPTDSWYLGSVHQARILRIKDGQASEFANAEDGLWSVFGMRLDQDGKSLWVATSATPNTAGLAEPERGQAKVLRFDLTTGEVTGTFVAQGAEEHWLGDLVQAPDGSIYATDSRAKLIYRLAPGAEELEPIADPEVFVSLQGLDWLPACQCLVVADYSIGLFKVNPADGVSKWLGVPKDASLLGIDGLYHYQGELIAIQNGTRPHRILRIRLDAESHRVNQVKVLAAGIEGWAEPTLGTIVEGRLHYTADSHWPDFDQQGALSEQPRSGPTVMWLEL